MGHWDVSAHDDDDHDSDIDTEDKDVLMWGTV